MLVSTALILLTGLVVGRFFQQLTLPRLLGYLITGIILGPYVLNALSSDFLSLSKDIRQIALIVILTRAGLTLDLKSLKKAGRISFLMCFLPASVEILACLIFAPLLLDFSLPQSLLLGAILGAVSPAVVVPRMIQLNQAGYGKLNHIPQIILAGSSIDDVFVLVVFAAAVGLNQGQDFSLMTLGQVPLAIVTGAIFGALLATSLSWLFNNFPTRPLVKVLTLLSFSFLLMALENVLKAYLPFSGMLAVMSMALFMGRQDDKNLPQLTHLYGQLWVACELFLFAFVGTETNIQFALSNGFKPLLLMIVALACRMIGVYLCLLGSPLQLKEKLFTMVAYCPKATVQAAIGSIPLSLGLKGGDIMLSIAVLAILLTAPIGAFAIDRLAPICLDK
ncbi:hypothetical protein D3H64_00585 [Atopobacter sp. AH10]|uniref:cation:proton antiporter n=1 Tax=Atopobacter sp. AH10 TaxID=2315861 RepID=UPI000EF1B49E|nr:cation:proton antiporter [Atopobacter sp. AH10]RLK64062.1 hypothetical protein D3H64_00585 [Atopobacter sp. AH10]